MRASGLLVLVSAALLVSCGSEVEDRPSILLITIDTLRADRLGCYGSTRETSPRIDQLAERAVVFDSARVPLPRTTQSLASLHTGLYPTSHGVRSLWDRLDGEFLTLGEVLRDNGFATGGVWAVPYFRDGQGIDQGLDFQRSWQEDVDAEVVSDSALEFLESTAEPFFLWVHYRDPHIPYGPPEPLRREFGGEYDGVWDESFFFYPIRGRTVEEDEKPPDRKKLKSAVVYGGHSLSDADVKRAIDLYDAEVAFTDLQIGRVIDLLARQRRLDDTVVVVTSDHGESLGEHDYYFDHGELLYDTCLRIPLLITGPGVEKRRVAAAVRSIDVMPTLLDLVGLEAPPVQGTSLRSLMDGREELNPRPLLAEAGASLVYDTHALRPVAGFPGRPIALVSGRWKLVQTPGFPDEQGFELYDIESDPDELTNLFGDPPADAPLDIFEQQRAPWQQLVRRRKDPGAPIDPEMLRQLESVGYIQSGGK